MRLGMIARCDDRGLGAQTFEFYRHMRPDVTVVIDMTPITQQRWAQHFDWYPDGIITPWKGYAQPLSTEALVALASCDVVFSAETFYDPRLPKWLHDQGVKTVLQPNPELYRNEQPTELWWPTGWLTAKLPKGRIMPVPIPDEQIADRPAGPGLLLHVGGWKALGDRNGSQFLPWLINRTSGSWRITSQSGIRLTPLMRNRVEPVGHIEDRWRLYDGCAILVMPRRYGGLCLPVQEAMARGLAVVMTDTEPNREWPIVPVEAGAGALVGMTLGPVQVKNCDLHHLIGQIEHTLANLEQYQAASLVWAHQNTWSRLGPLYRQRMESLLS